MPSEENSHTPLTGVAAQPKVIAGRYEVRDRIGQGAFGEVFEVYDQRLRRLVALKTLPIEAVTDAEATEELRRFHMEARAVARLSHPGIVTVHDFGETPEFAWIAMELVIGETLKAVLDRGERPGVGETVRVVGDLLEALHYAHGRGIVHRDVKPANILLSVTAAEGLGEVRLADFGVARIGGTQQTVVGQVVGTPIAMSPEQVRGEEVDLRSDLWSVGVILYQMLTGARPFPGGVPAIFQNILTQNPPAPSAIVAGLPPGLDAVVATALAKNPKDRYSSAAAMAAALRAAADFRALPEILAEAEARTVVMVPSAPVPAVPARADRPPARRGLALAAVFALGMLCGLVLPQLPAWDIPGAAAAGVLAFVAKLEEAGGHDAVPPPQAPRPAKGVAATTGVDAKAAIEPMVPLAAPPDAPAAPAGPPSVAPVSLLRPPVPRQAGIAVRCDRDRLSTRTGSHPGFGRIVFDWTVPIRHELEPAGNGALLRFPEAGCLPSVERLALPRNVRALAPDEAGTGLRIETAPGARLRLQRMDGNRTVVDVLDGED